MLLFKRLFYSFSSFTSLNITRLNFLNHYQMAFKKSDEEEDKKHHISVGEHFGRKSKIQKEKK